MHVPGHRPADHPRRRLLYERKEAAIRTGGRVRFAEQRGALRPLLFVADQQCRRPLLLRQLQQHRYAPRPLQPHGRHGRHLRHLAATLQGHQERQRIHQGRRSLDDRPRRSVGRQGALSGRSTVPAGLLPLPAGAGVGRRAPARGVGHLAQSRGRAAGRNAAGGGAQMVRR